MDLIFAFALGASIGSFLSVLATRGRQTFVISSQDSSHCPICKSPIKWPQKIPIMSYLALRGRCGKCKTKIPKKYLLIEVVMGLTLALSLLAFNISFTAIGVTALVASLMVLFFKRS